MYLADYLDIIECLFNNISMNLLKFMIFNLYVEYNNLFIEFVVALAKN